MQEDLIEQRVSRMTMKQLELDWSWSPPLLCLLCCQKKITVLLRRKWKEWPCGKKIILSDMEEEEAGFVVNKPWDNVSSCPYRDDPLPKLDATTDAGRGSNTVEVEGLVGEAEEDSDLQRTTQICTCGNCPTMTNREDQKCCHQVPKWQTEYKSGFPHTHDQWLIIGN